MTESRDSSKLDRTIHVLNRLAFGPRPGDVEHVRAVGPEAYVHEQLYPDSISIPDDLVERVRGYRSLQMTPIALFVEYYRPLAQARRSAKAEGSADQATRKDAAKDARIRERVVIREAAEARMLRAIEGPRQLQEVMTAFWFNHFNVFAGKGLDTIWTGAFEETAIRPHTMGKFRALLGATAHHPAMLFYLDNWQNTRPAVRVRRQIRRDQRKLRARTDGTAHARRRRRILAGRRDRARAHPDRMGILRLATNGCRRGRNAPVRTDGIPAAKFHASKSTRNRSERISFRFHPPRFFEQDFFGTSIEGAGIAEGEQALDILARSPATANHLSFKLAQYFVADDPPKPLVSRMAQQYLATDGDIRAVLKQMFTSRNSGTAEIYSAKFKTPYEYVVSCVRASGAPCATTVRSRHACTTRDADLRMPDAQTVTPILKTRG